MSYFCSRYILPYSPTPKFQHAPSVIRLHRLCVHLAKHLYASFKIYTPEVHAPPMLWRAVRCLHGTRKICLFPTLLPCKYLYTDHSPATLYTLSKKLASVLSIPMVLHHSLAPRLKRIKHSDPTYHMFDDAPVEVSLVAVVIVVLKLVYRLGEDSRYGLFIPLISFLVCY